MINLNIVSYFFKKCSYMIALPDDQLLTIGQPTDNVYFILEGEVEGINLTKTKYIKLTSGHFFGGYIPLFHTMYDYKAT